MIVFFFSSTGQKPQPSRFSYCPFFCASIVSWPFILSLSVSLSAKESYCTKFPLTRIYISAPITNAVWGYQQNTPTSSAKTSAKRKKPNKKEPPHDPSVRWLFIIYSPCASFSFSVGATIFFFYFLLLLLPLLHGTPSPYSPPSSNTLKMREKKEGRRERKKDEFGLT